MSSRLLSLAAVEGIPLHAVGAAPVAALGRADPQRGGDHVAGVVRRAADLGVLPAVAEVLPAPAPGRPRSRRRRGRRTRPARRRGPSRRRPATPTTRPSSTIRSRGGVAVADFDAEPCGHPGVVGDQALRRRRRCRCAGRRRRGSTRRDARRPGARTSGGTAGRGGAASAASPGPRCTSTSVSAGIVAAARSPWPGRRRTPRRVGRHDGPACRSSGSTKSRRSSRPSWSMRVAPAV